MLILVYGTLKRGYGNNRLLREATFIGEDVVQDYKLVFAGGRGAFPFAIEHPGTKIRGEVFDIGDDEHTLSNLDSLEGHPRWYRRTPVTTEGSRDVQFYVMPDPTGRINSDAIPCDINANNEYEWNRNV